MMTAPLIACQYFALCPNAAAGATEHPILSYVPTCRPCAERFDLALVAMEIEHDGETYVIDPEEATS